ncbi:unnamed protein product [Blepharisma stoltei]|uniref:Uncharacterized protein n=1 Tax=Blepharisma stoltei TaxID=1481888 RepID=A0AAU9KFW1_9CILI|nr:unnamed protein product [Blepharisma stoltei]
MLHTVAEETRAQFFKEDEVHPPLVSGIVLEIRQVPQSVADAQVWQLFSPFVQVAVSFLSFSVAFDLISWLDPWLSLLWESWLRISGSVMRAFKSPSVLSSYSMMLFCIAEASIIRIRINAGNTIYFQ